MVWTGGPLWTVPELLFESKKLIPQLQQLLINGSNDRITQCYRMKAHHGNNAYGQGYLAFQFWTAF
jgi:hypothetical protein